MVGDSAKDDLEDAGEHLENRERQLRIAEALLFASAEPLSAADIAIYLGEGANAAALLDELAQRYAVGALIS